MAELKWRWHKRAQRELESLPRDAQTKLMSAVQRYRRGESRRREVQSMSGTQGLYEIRAQVGGTWPRILFARDGEVSVGLTVFLKKQNQTEPQHIERAQRRR